MNDSYSSRLHNVSLSTGISQSGQLACVVASDGLKPALPGILKPALHSALFVCQIAKQGGNNSNTSWLYRILGLADIVQSRQVSAYSRGFKATIDFREDGGQFDAASIGRTQQNRYKATRSSLPALRCPKLQNIRVKSYQHPHCTSIESRD